jgi:hypothetical protein
MYSRSNLTSSKFGKYMELYGKMEFAAVLPEGSRMSWLIRHPMFVIYFLRYFNRVYFKSIQEM